MLINALKIVDVETDTIISLIQWFRLEVATNSIQWKAMWEKKRKTPEGNVMLIRSTDLTEVWCILDTYEGEIEKVDLCEANEIRVKNYTVVSTRAEKYD